MVAGSNPAGIANRRPVVPQSRAHGSMTMDIFRILIEQLADPFRIALLVALLFAAANPGGALNRWLPIALGLVFVAVLIPTALASDGEEAVSAQIGVGLLSNAIILGLMLFAEQLLERLRR
jgi:hypothetical protein